MLSERSMVKIRWLALGSALAFLAIMNVKQTRGLLLLVSAGVLYNLFLSSVKRPDYPESLSFLSTAVDLVGLTVLIAFTGGPSSVFILFMTIYLFALTMRHGVVIGLAAAVLSAAGLSFYYFTNPTTATQTAVLTRAVLFIIAPLGAKLIDVKTEKADKAEVEPVAEEAIVVKEVAIAEETPVAKETPVAEVTETEKAVVPEPAKEAAQVPEAAIEPAKEERPIPVEKGAEVAQPSAAPEKEAREEIVLTDVETSPSVEEAPGLGTLAEEVGLANDPEVPSGVQETKILREKITELATLHEASRALGASLIMEEVLDTVIDISAKGLHAEIAGALVFDEKTGLLKITGLRGLTSEEREVVNSTTFTPGEGILGEVFLKKKTQNFVDLSEERPGAAPFNGRIRSFLVTPLSTDGFDIGVLFLGKFVVDPFSASAEEFIETISGQAAIAVENAKLYTQAQELAIHNGLTGIYNYRYFMKQLEEEIKRAERYGRSVSLMMIDIDLFKHINDSYGHQRGDEVLKGLATTLINNTRETDVVARYGGEEFCVILPETEIADALDVAEKLRASVAKAAYAREKGHSVKITVSIGVAAFPGNAGNQEDLLRKADDALYEAKTKRNMVVSAGGGQTVK